MAVIRICATAWAVAALARTCPRCWLAAALLMTSPILLAVAIYVIAMAALGLSASGISLANNPVMGGCRSAGQQASLASQAGLTKALSTSPQSKSAWWLHHRLPCLR